jgi:hypothetical protein
MGKRLNGIHTVFVLLSLVSVSVIVAQQPRRRGPAPAPSAVAKSDLRIKYRMNTGGQTMESVSMIKGARERSETNAGYMNMVNIVQCDLKRSIQLSENARKYVITSMESDSSGSASSGGMSSGPAEPSRRGGVVTYTTTSIDTGERREMFGFTARHIKGSTITESSADACNPLKQKTERDGWYIDFSFGLDCSHNSGVAANYPSAPGGCKDRIQFRQVGSARTGYPLIETTTMYGADGSVTFTSTKEVVELSRDPLDAALFDVPAGYTEAQSSQELYVAPSMTSMTGPAMTGPDSSADDRTTMSSLAGAKAPGTIRVGVVSINNKSDRPVSLDELRARLVSGIEGSGVDAVPLNATTQAAAEAEARARQCDFILYTDISALKISAAKKLGGFLGKATGIGGAGKSDARVDFSLFAVGETSPRIQSSVTGKEEGDDASVGAALDSEARAVSSAVRKGR